MKDQLKQISLFIFLLTSVLVTEKLFHHSFEKFILSTLQRIDFQPEKFSKRITIIDTSPIYDLSIQRTNRAALADLLKAVKLGEPQSVGLDIRLDCDSLYQDDFGDSLVKEVLKDWKDIVVPGNADPNFEITDTKQLANIQIHDGYELLVSKHGQLSLPFRMASNQDIKIPEKDKNFIVNYRTTCKDIYGTEQLLNAGAVLKIFSDESLTKEEKQDELAMMLASQFVFIGFCNEALNVDRHDSPFGKQSGIVIWANAFHNLLNPDDRIQYNPFWAVLLWACITSFITLGLKNVYEKHNFFYPMVFLFSSIGQIFLWGLAGAWIYFSYLVYFPIFSFILISIIAFPVNLQIIRALKMTKILTKYPRISHIPEPLRRAYIEYLKERNPFKQLHLAFTLIEECVRFSALLGLAQAMSLKIPLAGLAKNLDLSRLTFGQWQQIMRTLSQNLKDNKDVLYDWKLIYYEKDDNNNWIASELLKDIDGQENKDLLSRLDDSKDERENLLKIFQSKFSLRANSALIYLKILELKWIKRIIYFMQTDDSKSIAKKIKQRFGDVKHLIQLRNRLVHDGGAFMKDYQFNSILPIFQKWIEIFFMKKIKFWKATKLVVETESGVDRLYLEMTGKKYNLNPYFIQKECGVHFNIELFSLASIDSKSKNLIFHGSEQNCRLVIKSDYQVDALLNYLND